MIPQPSSKTVRRLAAAEGYLELDLPEQALEQLQGIESLGPYSAVADLLTGEAFAAQERFTEAIEPLKRAAVEIPAPISHRAWIALSACYDAEGEDELAAEALGEAERAIKAKIVLRIAPPDQQQNDNPWNR